MLSLTREQRSFLARLRSFVPVAEAGGVPGSVMIGQAVLESGWGRSGLARLGTALFAVKAHAGWTGKVYSGTTLEFVHDRGYIKIAGPHRVYAGRAAALADGCDPRTLFRAYDSLEINVRDYVAFFHQNRRYRHALTAYARTRDPRRFAWEIARAGYATSPVYAQRLIHLMEWLTPDLLPAPATWTVRVNGAGVPKEAVRVVDGRVFVHIRPLARAMGMRLAFDARTRTVTLLEEAVE